MSMGYGGFCRKVAEDENMVIYEYAVYNLNMPEHKDARDIFDGRIIIEKSGLVEPEIHEKMKRMPSGRRKLVVKRIIREIPCEELFAAGKIRIEDCSHCWKQMELGCDFIAFRLVMKIFRYYQENDKLPEEEDCHF